MKTVINKITNNKGITLIILIGLLLRLCFILFGAHYYFGRENIFVDGDTFLWTCSFDNLIHYGTYTVYQGNELACFARAPGYTFFIGIFNLLCGGNWQIAFPVIAWAQLLMDVCAIWLMFRIGTMLFKNTHAALMLALLYATYPFIIVWNPVVYSESVSVFFMLWAICFCLKDTRYNFFIAGMLMSIAGLCRPQILLLLPITGLFLIIRYRKNLWVNKMKIIQFALAVCIFYGSWPLRNYIFHHQLALSQDLRGIATTGDDWLAFTKYVYSVKTEWEPQFSDLIQNKKVTFPKKAYVSKEDSLKLEHVLFLSSHCGSSFSHWKGYWKKPFGTADSNCNKEITKLFDELRINQIKANPFNFYVVLPLKNLKKAIFKSQLYKPGSGWISKFSMLLFYYRTLLILAGFAGGVILLIKNKSQKSYMFLILFSYCLLWYLTLCGGTSAQFRNIEMRYLLPADILLLIPGSYLVYQFCGKVFGLRS